MSNITPTEVVTLGGPNTNQVLRFFDAIAALSDEQAATFDQHDMGRWQLGATVGVAVATGYATSSVNQRSW